MVCPCCKLKGPHRAMVSGCIPALRKRIAELKAENNDLIVKVQFAEAVTRDEKQIERTATEDALRYAFAGTVHHSMLEGCVERGLKALLGEGE